MLNFDTPISEKKQSKNRIRNDVILIFSIVAILVIVYLCLNLFSENGTTVKITVDGKTFAEYSLNEDISVDILTGENDKNLNRLVIKNGKAYVETATCPDGICAAHKPISLSGESIVCLPHKVVISVYTKKAQSPDIIV